MPLVFYTVVTLVLTYPVVTQLATHTAGAAYGDSFEGVRAIWWTGEAISQGINPAQQLLLMYPEGFFSAVQWALPVAYLPGVLFAIIFPPLVAFNLAFLLASVLTGWTAYWFVRELTRHEIAALLGGLIVLAYPTRFGHAAVGHLGLITNYWRMLFLWMLVRVFLQRGGYREALLGGVFLGLALGTAPTNIAYEILPLAVVVGGTMAWQHRAEWRRWRLSLVVLGGVAALIGVVLYLPLFLEMMGGESTFLSETGTVRYSTDLLAFVLPSPFNPVVEGLGLNAQVAWDVLGDNAIEGSAYLGLGVVLLSAVALWKRRSEAGLWLVLALISMLLSLGPVLKVADQVATATIEGAESTAITLPYALYDDLPGLGMVRTPGRSNMTTAVALAVLAGYGWTVLSDWWAKLKRPQWQAGTFIAVSIVIMMEYTVFFPFPTTEVPVPAYFETLAAHAANDDVRPVLNVPAGDFFTNLRLLYDQTTHHQPVIAGHVIRNSPVNPALLTLVNAAAVPPEEDGFVPSLSVADQAGIIRATGAEVVVVHREFGDGATMAAYLPDVLGEPVYVDDRVTIFEVPPGPLPDRPLLAFDDGWAVEDGADARWIAGESAIAAYAPQDGEGYWTVEAGTWLIDRWLAVGETQQTLDVFPLAAGDDARGWQSAPRFYDAGFHHVQFVLPDGVQPCTQLPDEPDCRGAWVGTPRLHFEDEDQTPVTAFGDKMRLVNWRVMQPDADHLIVELDWQAVALSRADYTLFVHVVDAHGELVAQWDGPLLALGAPTSAWPEGAHGMQRAVIDWQDDPLPPGQYAVYSGLYTYPDLVRLPVLVDQPGAANGLFYLQDWTIAPSAVE